MQRKRYRPMRLAFFIIVSTGIEISFAMAFLASTLRCCGIAVSVHTQRDCKIANENSPPQACKNYL